MPSENWFALTLTLSPRRGNSGWPRWSHSLDGGCGDDAGRVLPLLEGEGRGEGERSIQLNRYGLEAIIANPTQAHIVIRFTAAAGKTYTLQFRDDLGLGA